MKKQTERLFSFQLVKPATTELMERARHAQTTPRVTQGWLLLKEAVIVCLPNVENGVLIGSISFFIVANSQSNLFY